MSNNTLEELTYDGKKFYNSFGLEVNASYIGNPTIVEVHEWSKYQEYISKDAPKDANAFVRGKSRIAAVLRPPVWDNLAVMYCKF
jgi:hypothetical protein